MSLEEIVGDHIPTIEKALAEARIMREKNKDDCFFAPSHNKVVSVLSKHLAKVRLNEDVAALEPSIVTPE